VNLCYCIVRATFNLSICMMNKIGNTDSHSLCKTPMKKPTVRVCRCISKAKGIVPLLLALFTVQNTNGLFLSVYSRGEGNCSLPLEIVFQMRRELFPFSCRWWQLKSTEWVADKVQIIRFYKSIYASRVESL
jgi:hypothetical protein